MNILFLKKKISAILFALILGFSGSLLLIPKEVEATFVPVGDVVNFEFHAFGQLKEQGLDILAWALAKEAINALTGDIIEWVNTGFNGNPAFVQSPYGYLQDIGDQTATDFIQQRRGFLGNAPFGDQVVQGLVYDYSKTYYSQPYDLDRILLTQKLFCLVISLKGVGMLGLVHLIILITLSWVHTLEVRKLRTWR